MNYCCSITNVNRKREREHKAQSKIAYKRDEPISKYASVRLIRDAARGSRQMASNTEFYIKVCHEGLYTEAMLETGKGVQTHMVQ